MNMPQRIFQWERTMKLVRSHCIETIKSDSLRSEISAHLGHSLQSIELERRSLRSCCNDVIFETTVHTQNRMDLDPDSPLTMHSVSEKFTHFGLFSAPV